MIEIERPSKRDVYEWCVVYRDGTRLYERSGKELVGWAAVGPASVEAIVLLWDGQPQHQINIPEGAQPVFFRRRSATINPDTGNQQPHPTIHCIGWEKQGQGCYLFISEIGCTLLTDNKEAV